MSTSENNENSKENARETEAKDKEKKKKEVNHNKKILFLSFMQARNMNFDVSIRVEE